MHGHKAEEMEEKFGFMVENNVARLEALGDFSLHTEDSEYNALGYNCMGVYLCRFVDVCLQHALVKFCGSNVIRLVICKVRIYMSLYSFSMRQWFFEVQTLSFPLKLTIPYFIGFEEFQYSSVHIFPNCNMEMKEWFY